MSNLLNITPEYQITRTASGVWRRYLYSSGAIYSEFTSHTAIGGWPLIHIARGRSPETGKIATARGIIAIGQKAIGVIAVGQAAAGVIAVGQAVTGVIAVGQAAAGILIGVGQVATGLVTVAQFGIGWSLVAQGGIGHTGNVQFGLGPETLHRAMKGHP